MTPRRGAPRPTRTTRTPRRRSTRPARARLEEARGLRARLEAPPRVPAAADPRLTKDADDVIASAEAALRADDEGFHARLNSEWFFQPWFQYTMFLLLFVGFAIKVP